MAYEEVAPIVFLGIGRDVGVVSVVSVRIVITARWDIL
jgi:hypothetical protein